MLRQKGCVRIINLSVMWVALCICVWFRHFTAQHLDWKAHRWCNTDTVLLANATALQMDQLRNLPQHCAQWDLYKKLCSAVAELQVLQWGVLLCSNIHFYIVLPGVWVCNACVCVCMCACARVCELRSSVTQTLLFTSDLMTFASFFFISVPSLW